MSGEDLLQAIAEQLSPRPPKRLGVAVSGGGDSMALLCLTAEYVRGTDIELHAVTVDHGLRQAAKDEVRLVMDTCGRLGIPHHVEFWQTWAGQGNLMAEAREARYELMSGWAHANDIEAIALAHTANDQAETLMMRLARGAGVDGLSAMASRRVQHGVMWLRPLLRVHRRELRYYLESNDIRWVEDPTNEDRDFERVRMRDALRLLEPLGLGIDTLVGVADNMSKAREALDWQTFLAARDMSKVSHGAIALDLRRFRTLPEEIARRMLVRAISWLSGNTYAPRRASMLGAVEAVRNGRTHTLDGCQMMREDDLVWIFREYNAVRDTVAEVGETWDNRWILTGPEDDPSQVVRALGEFGLRQIDEWRETGVPRAALAGSPAVWEGDELIAAPVAGMGEGWTAELDGGNDAYFAAILSH